MSRIVFDQISGHHDPAKSTHKGNQYSRVVPGAVLGAGVFKVILRNQPNMVKQFGLYLQLCVQEYLFVECIQCARQGPWSVGISLMGELLHSGEPL